MTAQGTIGSPGTYAPPVPQSDVSGLVAALAALTAALTGKAATSHTHGEADVTSLVADLLTLTNAVAGKAATSHTHAESDVTSLVADLAAKVPATRSVSAGTGLTGGGALTADRTLTVDQTVIAPLAAPSFTGGVTAAGGLTVSSGVGRVIDVATTADQTINNSTTLVDAGNGATVLQAALEAAGVYEVSGLIVYSSSTTADLKLGWTGLTTPTLHWTGGGLTSGAAAASASINLGYDAYTDSQIVGGIGVGTKLVAMLKGRVIVAGAGTLKLQVAQGALDATNTVIYAGSSLTFRRVA